ncbi:MAG: RNA polymerase sigma factor [Verrucomicrobiota bacterium]
MNPTDTENVQSKQTASADDAVWVQQAQAGESAGWAELHREYYPKLWSVVNQIILDASIAEDIVQESFIKAYRQIGRFRGQSKFGTWIYRIAVNQALDAVRKKNRRQRWFQILPWNQEDDENDPVQELPAPEKTMSEAERTDLRTAIARALEILTPEHRAVVELRLVQGLSTEETAQILKCKKGTVLSRLFYSCQKLQPILKQTYEELG